MIRAASILLAAALLSACAAKPPLANVPAKLQPAAGQSFAMVVPATGVQIYECRVRKDAAGQYEWAFVGPEADLFDTHGRRSGKHYGGPNWEALDGSRVVGSLKERADAPGADAPGADAIPWLLLNAKSTGPAGAFSKVTAIQRVNTVGGVAPKAACSQANLGAAARVPYTADYYFFTGS